MQLASSAAGVHAAMKPDRHAAYALRRCGGADKRIQQSDLASPWGDRNLDMSVLYMLLVRSHGVGCLEVVRCLPAPAADRVQEGVRASNSRTEHHHRAFLCASDGAQTVGVLLVLSAGCLLRQRLRTQSGVEISSLVPPAGCCMADHFIYKVLYRSD